MGQKGFANILLVVLVVVLAGALGYITLIKKPASVVQLPSDNAQNVQPTPTPPSTLNNSSTAAPSDGFSPVRNNTQIVKYSESNTEQKTFLDSLINTKNSMYIKEKIILFYFDTVKDVAVVGEPGTNNLLVGFFHPSSQAQEGGLFVVNCVGASSLSSSCSYLINGYLVLFIDDDSVGPGGGGILVYKIGDATYYSDFLKESTDYTLGGTYVREYASAPTLDTSFDGETITATLYKDNQNLGMGQYDLTKKNEKLRTVTFDLRNIQH